MLVFTLHLNICGRDAPSYASFRSHVRVMWKDMKQPWIKLWPGSQTEVLWYPPLLAVQGWLLDTNGWTLTWGRVSAAQVNPYLSAKPLRWAVTHLQDYKVNPTALVFQLLNTLSHDLDGWKLVRHTQREITKLSTLMSSCSVVMVEVIVQCPLVKGQDDVLEAHSYGGKIR